MELIPNGEKNHPPAVALRHGGRRPAIHDFPACISKVMDADLRRHDGVHRGRRVGLYAGWYETAGPQIEINSNTLLPLRRDRLGLSLCAARPGPHHSVR